MNRSRRTSRWTAGSAVPRGDHLEPVLDERELVVLVAEQLDERRGVAVGLDGLVEGGCPVGAAGALALDDLFDAQTRGLAELRGGRGAPERLGQPLRLARELEAAVLQPARDMQRPGLVAEVALELAEDGRHREAGELGAATGLEAVDRLDEPDAGDLDEVVERLLAVAVAAGELACEREVALDQLVAQPRVARVPVLGEQLRLVGGVGRARRKSRAARGEESGLRGNRRQSATSSGR